MEPNANEPNTRQPNAPKPDVPRPAGHPYAAGEGGDGPLFTKEEFAEMQRETKKAHAGSLTSQFATATMEFVVRLQRGQNEAAMLAQGEKIGFGAAYNAVGQLLYLVGTQTEYTGIRFARAIRALGGLCVRAFAALFRFVCGPLWALLTSIGEDFAVPVRYMVASVREMRHTVRAEAEAGGNARRAGFDVLRGRLHTYRGLIFRALNYLMPLAAFAVLFFTVREVLGANFSLGVTFGDTLVFVENEMVWDEAEQMVRERVQASAGGTVEWDAHPQFELRIVDPAARTGVSELADKIISASSDQIKKAVGIRVNGELVSIVEDGPAVQKLLDDTLAAYDAGEHDSVAYLYPIEQVPGIYFTSSVQDTTMALQALESSTALSVKVIDTIEYDETIPYTAERQESDEYRKGYEFVSQAGEDGVRHVVAEQMSINGEVISVVPQSYTVTKEMVPEITTVGTRTFRIETAVGGEVIGSGSLIFPVPELKYITTPFSWRPGGGGHRGIDLCAPANSPILAADAGVVIEVGMHHYSWGNYVLIDHGNGLTTRYAHCNDVYVSAGQSVAGGELIAGIGMTGIATGYHCHFEVEQNGVLINPAPLLGVS